MSKFKLIFAFLLLLPLAAMAQTPYIITSSGSQFSATKGDVDVEGANRVSFQNVINAIRTDANGANCEIQFGDGTNTISRSASTTFNNTSGTWGDITLSGKITTTSISSTIIVNGPNLNSKADIIKTEIQAIVNDGSGTLTISGGTISASGNSVIIMAKSTLIITGGTISATGEGYAVSGGADGGTLIITGGTISATNGYAVKSGALINSFLLGGNPDITGIIYGGLSVITNPDIGTIFAPGDKVYTIDVNQYTLNRKVVVDGKDFLSNFKLADANYGLIVSGNDLVIASAEDACEATAGNQWIDGVCKTPAQLVCEATAGNQWVDGVCKTPAQLTCEANTSKVWENGACKDKSQPPAEDAKTLCEANANKIWENGTCKDKPQTPVTPPTPPNNNPGGGNNNQVTTTPSVNYYSIRVSTTTTGGTAYANRISAAKGDPVALTAEPSEGYRFKEWIVKSGSISLSDKLSPSATFTMPDNLVSLEAVFESLSVSPTIARNSYGSITAQAINGGVLLQNLPQNAKIELYNIHGKHIYSANSENSQILKIMVQTKGIYIAKINNNTMKIAVK